MGLTTELAQGTHGNGTFAYLPRESSTQQCGEQTASAPVNRANVSKMGFNLFFNLPQYIYNSSTDGFIQGALATHKAAYSGPVRPGFGRWFIANQRALRICILEKFG